MSPPNLRWLTGDGPQVLDDGVSFGMPWPKGMYPPGQNFVIEANGNQWPLDSREIAYWPDDSLKWSAHSVSGDNENYLSVITPRGLQVNFAPEGGSAILKDVVIDGRPVCSGATVIASIDDKPYTTIVKSVELENSSFGRVLIKVSGAVLGKNNDAQLPFDVRFYIHSNASSVKIIHSFIHDLDSDQPLTSLGLRFFVPLGESELYNRHIRYGGSDGGVLKEEVKGLSGLRHGPTIQNRVAQTSGYHVSLNEANWTRTELTRGLSYIPSWDSYSLSQLSPDGFTIKKRTKPECSWVKVTAGGRSDGTVFVGSADSGGIHYCLALLPLAGPLETTPFHDGLGLDSYDKQLEALDVTYEDFEPGFVTANGIARTNQIILKPFRDVPSNHSFSAFSSLVRNPPRLVATATHMHDAHAFHGCWAPDFRISGKVPPPKEIQIEENLDLLFNYYHKQVEQNRWYGFWDYGDVQHTYDAYRHAWRYDVGGFAWDNSELSTDLWLWLYFLHTGRADVFKMAEAMTRHTGEVDVYHSGKFKGFGTRHGVQHFSDSSKQLRISNVLYRRIYYYLTGDERTGDLISELQESQNTLLVLDSHRKVQKHAGIPDGFAMTNIGLDCGPLLATWLTAWERRVDGWTRFRELVFRLLEGISSLNHGIGNNSLLLDPSNGEVRECPPPTPEHTISHLSMLFGFPEVIAELSYFTEEENSSSMKKFMEVWLSYCRAYNGGPDVQRKEFGFEFPDHATWRQSHSTLTAFAAVEQNSDYLAKVAWDQFFDSDGYTDHLDWTVLKTSPPEYFSAGEEAPWVSTNETARYGVSAISNLANIGEYLKHS
ncbi:hypothetical protein N7533_003022 [Penicillium manginii]|uniref:uncharacterized protein n=1 Tax=Penicillium manginii TaxID=203109 RepID=UPI0025482E75|nr:uncharacterized protein N7533_003022 [Penicillium manginii]KAJ5764341.1 hypothetical protein N7533_003022 [Penicillium manginii]